MILASNFNEFRYFDFSRHWTKTLNPIIQLSQAQSILNQDFKKYISVKRANYIRDAIKNGLSADSHKWYFSEGKFPADFDSCDWRDGRLPAWHQYVCHGACHYIANTLLYVASTAYPNKAWRIITSSLHSTIWDGDKTLFDLNFVTLRIPVHECVEMAFMQSDSRALEVGEYMQLVTF